MLIINVLQNVTNRLQCMQTNCRLFITVITWPSPPNTKKKCTFYVFALALQNMSPYIEIFQEFQT